MELIGKYLENQEKLFKELSKHPRHKLIDVIWKRVNTDRVSAGYKPLPKKVFAIKTSHLSLDDMHYLVKKMCQSALPGKVFFGMLKVKKDVAQKV